MKLRKLSDYLDSLFHVTLYDNMDTSFSAKIHYFSQEIISDILPSFLKRYNGLMLENSKEISFVTAACFLSDEIVNELKTNQMKNVLLICHHMLDIDAGQPGNWNAKGFSAISVESFTYLKNNGISVYILHLPLDANQSKINTHLSLCNRLGLIPQQDMLRRNGYTMGYLAQANSHWLSVAEENFSLKLIFGDFLENSLLADAPIAILAGMVSSVSMLEEIRNTGCSCLVCGDVLLRQKTKRAEDISQWLTTTPFPILCFSHKATEEPALKDLLKHVNELFPAIPTTFLSGESTWK